MDSTDFQLLVALHENARQSYRSLGRRVSLTAPAVRGRLKRLQDLGVLHGYGLVIDPSVFGRDELIVLFHGERTRQDVAKALAAPDVAYVAWKLEGGLTVGVWSHDRKRSVRNLTNALKARPSGQTLTERRQNFRPLSILDWQIIDALVDDPKMPLKKLIEVTGLSPKTIRNHLGALVESSIISVMPRQGSVAGSGEIVYHLAIAGEIDIKELHKLMGDAVLLHKTQKPPMKYLLCRESDLGSLAAKTRALSKLAGVKSVAATLNRELLFATEFTHTLIREQIQKLKALQH